MKIDINNENEMIKYAHSFSKTIKKGDILCLVGDLASGKTFFTKHLLYSIGIKEEVISPTFCLIKNYKTKDNINVNHFDVYRLKSENDLYDIGFYDYIYDENSINIIEWADLIKNEIPNKAIWINIKKIDDNKRVIYIDEK